ncbi:MAG TPA: lycopene cyclase domain-containing protein [Acidimicrobiia bacterium]|nr:lycopene cyclase domain-containing protein [Acidimicrobiia bacterium]
MYAYVLGLSLLLTLPLYFVTRGAVFKNYKAVLRSMSLPVAVYLIWDIIATHFGHWLFDPAQTSHLRFAGIPIEEYFFFIIIPLCALVTYETVTQFNGDNFHIKGRTIFIGIALYTFVGAVVEMFFRSQRVAKLESPITPWYTFATFAVMFIFVLWVLNNKERKNVLLSGPSISTLGICLFFMIFVNGLLTQLSNPVVSYKANIGVRLYFDIPVEDFFYGTVLLAWILLRYQREKVRC